jgi:hypothetical protein
VIGYDQIQQRLEALTAPPDEDAFSVEWLVPDVLAVGRDAHGRYAVILPGDALSPSPNVASVHYGEWRSASGSEVRGTLLALPAGNEFRTAAAAIAAECIRIGIHERPLREVYREVEPFIALVLRRIVLPEESLLGLVGELLILDQLVDAVLQVQPDHPDPTVFWTGWQPRPRDFSFGAAALEVKTTGLLASRHHISNIAQVDPEAAGSGAQVHLYLASIGLRRASAGAFSIAGLSQRILERLAAAVGDAPTDPRTLFLDRLRQYGPDGFAGYDHATMSAAEPYQQRFSTTFLPRIYDMQDHNVRVIRRKDLTAHFPFVLDEGLSFAIELPAQIPGSLTNPAIDLQESLGELVQRVIGNSGS